MNNSIILTDDGSNSLFNNDINESYHSKHGAINESQHIFINYGLQYIDKKEIKIFEVGFGTGLNALLSFLYSKNKKIRIDYQTIEKFPLGKPDYYALNFSEQLNINKNIFTNLHRSKWESKLKISDFFSITKYAKDLNNFNHKCYYDLIYFDAFSPEKQPDLWTEKIFKGLYNNLNYNGVLITYCAKGVIKRKLKKIGFQVFAFPGPNGKREITQARKI